MERKKRVLVVDDDPSIHSVTDLVFDKIYELLHANDGDEGLEIVKKDNIDIILTDMNMRSEEEGLKFIPLYKEVNPDLDIIVLSANSNLDLASKTAKAGASAYLVKDPSADQLLVTFQSVIARRELLKENEHYVQSRKRNLRKNQIIGKSSVIQTLLRDIEKVKRSKANVIIHAETGAGKELVAKHIGISDSKPFVSVDSGTITSSLAESLLFGYEKGAFTGANQKSKGMFEEADGGSIYFDEIANMPIEIQIKLLRVIQEKEIRRLGSTKSIPLDFRVICATNRNLEVLAKEGKFLYDLLQRLNVIEITIPSLRERKEDIPELLNHFIEANRFEGAVIRFSKEALKVLANYQWPGNIRELSNLVANLSVMYEGNEEIQIRDLPLKIQNEKSNKDRVTTSSELEEEIKTSDFYEHMREVEKRFLLKVFNELNGNIPEMCKKLNISRSNLYTKLNAHQIS